MKEKPMDKFLEEMSSSEKEREELQEVASLLGSMQEELPSSSFQASLKESLMEQAREQADNASSNSNEHNEAGKQTVVRMNSDKERRSFYWKRFRPMVAVAAAAAVILAFVLFFDHGLQTWGPGADDPGEPSGRIITIRNFFTSPEVTIPADEEEKHRDVDNEKPDDELYSEYDEDDIEGEVPDDKEDVEKEQKPEEEETSGEQDASEEDREQPGKEPSDDDDKDPSEPDETDKPETDPEEEKDPLDPEPEFDIWDKEQSVRLAGVVDLPELKYDEKADDEQEPVGNIEYSWRPGMFMEASVKTDSLGTTEWAGKLLSDEGFTVDQDDTLEINKQETQKGKFVEIMFIPRRSSSLPVVVYYQEDRGIIGYYYEEKGSALQAGYYPILSPSRAFEQIEDVPVYSEHKRLDFSFRKVALEYHDFVIKEDSEQRLAKLPAYRFTGMEISKGDEEIEIYLPAVSLP